jgi:molybdopterin-binding protein
MRLSAHNMLKGKAKRIKSGAVNTEVIIELPGGPEIVSIIRKESADRPGLAAGKEAYAIVEASNVMIGVE